MTCAFTAVALILVAMVCEFAEKLAGDLRDEQASLQQQAALLQHERRMQKQFLACFNHELKTPLNAILNSLDCIKKSTGGAGGAGGAGAGAPGAVAAYVHTATISSRILNNLVKVH